jgi:hypothetical protein
MEKERRIEENTNKKKSSLCNIFGKEMHSAYTKHREGRNLAPSYGGSMSGTDI